MKQTSRSKDVDNHGRNVSEQNQSTLICLGFTKGHPKGSTKKPDLSKSDSEGDSINDADGGIVVLLEDSSPLSKHQNANKRKNWTLPDNFPIL